jgi:hypothetical protein
MSSANWGSLFQLAVSPFNWIDRVMGEVAKKVGQMVNEEAAQWQAVEGQCNPNEDVETIIGLVRM